MIIASKTMFKISLFGWELVIFRYRSDNKLKPYQDQGIQPEGAYIKREGNFLMACNDKGEYIRKQIALTLNDNVSGPSTVTVEYFFAGIYEEKDVLPKDIEWPYHTPKPNN